MSEPKPETETERSLVDPKEFEEQGALVRKAAERLYQAENAFGKARAELNAADLDWQKAWSIFNRYAQKAAGLRYQERPDADQQIPTFPCKPADVRWKQKDRRAANDE